MAPDNLVNDILSTENYMNFVVQLDDVSDAKNLLDFTWQWLYSLSNRGLATVDMDRRASRFMLAIISRMYDVPLFNIPYDPDSYAFPLLLTVLAHKLKVRNISNWNELLLRSDRLTLPM